MFVGVKHFCGFHFL